jgi:Domain of unknown function (DUF4936)
VSGGGRSLYIYWKVAPARLPQALRAVRRFQSEACLAAEVSRVLRRADAASGGPITLMETYGAPGGLSPARAAALVAQSAAALGDWAEAGRHVEVFEPA